MSAATVTDRSVETNGKGNRLTETLEEKLSHPATSPDFDLKKGVNEVLADIGMTSHDCGGELSFYGQDPILPSPLRFGTMAAIGLAARSVAVAALDSPVAGRFAKHAIIGYFRDGLDTDDPNAIAQMASALLRVDRDSVLAGISDSEVKAIARQHGEAAVTRGVFGSPWIFVDGEPFWGSDRLAMVERWLGGGPW
jgi:2-hydroxychromene-2-carboxylate isomerase